MARKIKGIYSKKAEQAELGLQNARTALYIRVSTQLQAEEGFSLEAQRERLEAHCTAQGWTVVPEHVFVDAGVSGKTTDRPQFQAMLQAAKEGKIQRIVAMRLDRIARNTKDFLTIVEQLKAHNCALALVKENFETSTPQGKFAITLFAAIAEMEASMITERVMTGKAQKASSDGARGYFNGARIPYGYMYSNGVFSVNERQAATVKAIFTRFLDGESLYRIANWLNESNFPSPATKEGEPPKSWVHTTVRHMLTNGFYAGLAEWNGIEGKEGKHPRIIERSTYEAALDRIKQLTQGRPRTKAQA